jgi:hypothetical protein
VSSPSDPATTRGDDCQSIFAEGWNDILDFAKTVSRQRIEDAYSAFQRVLDPASCSVSVEVRQSAHANLGLAMFLGESFRSALDALQQANDDALGRYWALSPLIAVLRDCKEELSGLQDIRVAFMRELANDPEQARRHFDVASGSHCLILSRFASSQRDAL